MILSQRLAIAGGSIIVFTVVFGFLAFDQILRFGIRDVSSKNIYYQSFLVNLETEVLIDIHISLGKICKCVLDFIFTESFFPIINISG